LQFRAVTGNSGSFVGVVWLLRVFTDILHFIFVSSSIRLLKLAADLLAPILVFSAS
jgi:hypothetical protein